MIDTPVVSLPSMHTSRSARSTSVDLFGPDVDSTRPLKEALEKLGKRANQYQVLRLLDLLCQVMEANSFGAIGGCQLHLADGELGRLRKDGGAGIHH